jgi:hypothetical protein
MNPNLIEKLRSYIEFNADEERFISSVFKIKHFAKGEHFLLAGDVCREAAFIESGVFRFYIIRVMTRLITLQRKTNSYANIRVFFGNSHQIETYKHSNLH